MRSGDTPAIRLDQDATGGFDEQIWDIGGNEANFFIRDATNGSRLSFRIRPGAPVSSIDIGENGNVGIGQSNATAPLHVSRSDGSAQLKVEETNTTRAARDLIQLTNNGPSRIRYTDTSLSSVWGAGTVGRDYVLNNGATPWDFVLDRDGNLTLNGNLSQLSDRRAKDDIEAVDPDSVLAKLADLPVSTWSYEDDRGVMHVGPMAQDFFAAFGYGEDRRHIAPADLAGVAVAGVKELDSRQRDAEQKLGELRERKDALDARVKVLEAAISGG